jgi:hypothetical protein
VRLDRRAHDRKEQGAVLVARHWEKVPSAAAT